MKRLIFEGPNWEGFWHVQSDGWKDQELPVWVPERSFREFLKLFREKPSGGHAGDEYGNCSLYFRCGLFGIVWFYPTGHYQTGVELPDPGAHPWIDAHVYR